MRKERGRVWEEGREREEVEFPVYKGDSKRMWINHLILPCIVLESIERGSI